MTKFKVPLSVTSQSLFTDLKFCSHLHPRYLNYQDVNWFLAFVFFLLCIWCTFFLWSSLTCCLYESCNAVEAFLIFKRQFVFWHVSLRINCNYHKTTTNHPIGLENRLKVSETPSNTVQTERDHVTVFLSQWLCSVTKQEEIAELNRKGAAKRGGVLGNSAFCWHCGAPSPPHKMCHSEPTQDWNSLWAWFFIL